jgi:hypothetical protein
MAAAAAGGVPDVFRTAPTQRLRTCRSRPLRSFHLAMPIRRHALESPGGGGAIWRVVDGFGNFGGQGGSLSSIRASKRVSGAVCGALSSEGQRPNTDGQGCPRQSG